MELLHPDTKEIIVRLLLTAWGALMLAVLVAVFTQAVLDLQRRRRDPFWPSCIAAALAFVGAAVPLWMALGG